jgi:excisionase family DNA binding protein
MYKDMEFHNSILRVNIFLKAKDVAEILQISRAMAYTLMQRGEIPTVRIGQARRVRPEDLISYIKNNTYQENQ